MQVEDFLADLRSVLIDREGQYGEAGKSFRRIARFWSMYLTEKTGVKVTLSPMDVGQMMNLFKMSRIVNTPVPPEDSSIDQCACLRREPQCRHGKRKTPPRKAA